MYEYHNPMWPRKIKNLEEGQKEGNKNSSSRVKRERLSFFCTAYQCNADYLNPEIFFRLRVFGRELLLTDTNLPK